MGGTTCSRLNCSGVVEDCAIKIRSGGNPNSIWTECAGSNGGLHAPGLPESSFASNAHGAALSEAYNDRVQGADHYKDGAAHFADASAMDFNSFVRGADEPEVTPTVDRFAVCRASRSTSSASADYAWRRRYALGRELGTGQTAVVYEARCVGMGLEGWSGERDGAPDGKGRRVALKKFNRAGTSMYRQEVRALKAISIHPNVMRLLESFEGGEDTDALILEYCEGGDVYELYAGNNGVGMLEGFVAQLLRQLLSALAHLVECGVEHRDVKPENLLLHGTAAGAYPCLKLADFGWAVVVNGTRAPTVPPEGVGSLWYAPPELNPPVPGHESIIEPFSAETMGRSDMWSVGVIAYLLLVGHSPFNTALRQQQPAAMEKEVLRMAAAGELNMNARGWPRLSPLAQDFVKKLVVPRAKLRPLPSEALLHPFILEGCKAYSEHSTQIEQLPVTRTREREQAWKSLDGFQRMCWLAISRAVSEPELLEAKTGNRRFTCQQYGGSMAGIGRGTYLEHLAAELVVLSVPTWFQGNAGWGDVIHLAFRYLDLDSDGVLGLADLQAHVDDQHKALVSNWVSRWQRSPQHESPQPCLGFTDFRWTLWSTCLRPQSRLGLESEDTEDATNTAAEEEAMVEKRLQDLELVCNRYFDEILFPETTDGSAHFEQISGREGALQHCA
eukprot:TRINITY_DN110912_c0_g1_i1.p1 TRINITY_DN110912_c0_g1~~TRINITY_DN110912_c0_g1_i1.p1  ORF type:complete len:672 (-),score=138.02 TRINITY_DN110912_c0_g1_i1:171-2186(-)